MDANAIGHFIAELRKQKGYTQKDLAEQLAVTDKAVSRWETGKGLPDTSLLKPLSELLGVSVGELLAGERMEETAVKEQTDQVILDALKYSGRMLVETVTVVLFIIGTAFLLSPWFLAGQRTYYWVIGVVFIVVAVGLVILKKKGITMKLNNRIIYTLGLLFQTAALILELLPTGAVLIFMGDPRTGKVFRNTYSYFDLTLYGYANFTPLLTGLLTIVILLLGIITLCRFQKAARARNAAFICTIIALVLSLLPPIFYGTDYLTATSCFISAALLLSLCSQAVANRKR